MFLRASVCDLMRLLDLRKYFITQFTNIVFTEMSILTLILKKRKKIERSVFFSTFEVFHGYWFFVVSYVVTDKNKLHIFNMLSTPIAVKTMVILTASSVDNMLKMWKIIVCSSVRCKQGCLYLHYSMICKKKYVDVASCRPVSTWKLLQIIYSLMICCHK